MTVVRLEFFSCLNTNGIDMVDYVLIYFTIACRGVSWKTESFREEESQGNSKSWHEASARNCPSADQKEQEHSFCDQQTRCIQESII